MNVSLILECHAEDFYFCTFNILIYPQLKIPAFWCVLLRCWINSYCFFKGSFMSRVKLSKKTDFFDCLTLKYEDTANHLKCL